MSSTEVPGLREARDRVQERLRESGLPADAARRIADQSAQRIDRRVDAGQIQRPRQR